MRVYLAGPINGCDDSQANDWRTEAKKWILSYRDPMDRDYRGKEDENVAAIVHGDMNDIRGCDAILANCPFPSVGTSMEILYAKHCLGKRVVTIVPKDARISPWLHHHSDAIVNSLEDGIKAVFA